MIYTDIERLNEPFKSKAIEWLNRCKQAGLFIKIRETLRTNDVQKAYYAQGRQPLNTTNQFRAMAGLGPITNAENRNQITWTLNSEHLDGLALDFTPYNPQTGKDEWDNYFAFDTAGKIALDMGMGWGVIKGGQRVDKGHIQLKPNQGTLVGQKVGGGMGIGAILGLVGFGGFLLYQKFFKKGNANAK